MRTCNLVVVLLIGGLSSSLCAQQPTVLLASDQGLPDAPSLGAMSETPDRDPPPQEFTSTIAGTILDTNGTVISDARVELEGTVERVTQSGENGQFTFSNLPPGSFRLTVSAPGMEAYVSPEFTLGESDMHLLPKIVLPVASTSFEVRVSGDRNEVAEEEVHIAVEQRVLGVLPNFYSVYDWNAPPLGTREKYKLAIRDVTDPAMFIGDGVLAAIEQEFNDIPAYGQGLKGYAKRFGAAYANDSIDRVLSAAIFPSIFHQDPRFFYKDGGSTVSRGIYAVSATVMTRTDDGHHRPNYSRLLGSFASGALSNLYTPAANRGVSVTLINGMINLVGNAGNNLLREFVYKGLTTNVPNYANGKP
jgi:hypothetical protein